MFGVEQPDSLSMVVRYGEKLKIIFIYLMVVMEVELLKEHYLVSYWAFQRIKKSQQQFCPKFLQNISEANPFFYMIDGFRYSFIGVADGSITVGIVYLSFLSFFSWLVTYILFKKGYKIRS